MPEHSSWLTLIVAWMQETLSSNVENLGRTLLEAKPMTWHHFEPITTALVVAAILIGVGFAVRARLADTDHALIPEDRLTLRTFIEAFLGYFYDLAKSVMGPERAKEHFPIIATAALFVFGSNIMALIPGFPVATSNLNITFGCALIVFIVFNFYGLKEHGFGYIKHLAGPNPYLAPLLFPIELFSLLVRPVTLAVRLMLNMAVDHLILGVFLGLFALLIPVPVMVLGVLIVFIQTLVFALLTCIYIGLATDHEAH